MPRSHSYDRAKLREAALAHALTSRQVAALIDHTALKAETTPEDVEQLCRDAIVLGCAAVCVNPGYVDLAGSFLGTSELALCSVIDFPLGAGGLRTKQEQTHIAALAGAVEFDMVANIGHLVAGDLGAVERETAGVRGVLDSGQVLKVIIETALFDDQTIRDAARAAVAGGADFVKTSTGFHSAGGATVAAVAALASAVPSAGVKASGGIRTWTQAIEMIAAGANRLGISATRAVLAGAPGG